MLSSPAFRCNCKIPSAAMNSIRLFSPNSNPMNPLTPPPVRSYRATIRRLIPTVFRNLAANFEAVADEPRGDVIRRHLLIRLHGGSGSASGGARGGENFCGGLCVICQNEFADCERVGVLDCSHEYHEIHSWLMSRNVCPLCQ